MLNAILCYWDGWFERKNYLQIPETYVKTCSQKAQASDWHTYAIRRRPWRPHVCVPCTWLSKAMPRSAHIFEAGCGSGANLLWLWQEGFTRLGGNDISPEAVRMCALLAEYSKASVEARVDDALAPTSPPRDVDVLLSLNWLYHVPGASLHDLFDVYANSLSPHGYVVFDVVSHRYNQIKNNQFHSKDKELPEEQRRPSEYTFRMSPQEVQDCVKAHGFTLLRCKHLWGKPPHLVCVARRGQGAPQT